MRPNIRHSARKCVQRPFRRAVLRGLGVVLPPLLTIVILVWILSTIQGYVLTPFEGAAKRLITWSIDDTRTEIPPAAELKGPASDPGRRFEYQGQEYRAIGDEQWIPLSVYRRVKQNPGLTLPETSQGFYHRYVELTYLKRYIVLPFFLLVFVLLLYLLGRFLAYGMGRVMYNSMEATIRQLPIIRSVYTSVKQVTDFVFSENDVEFTRVVAIEYPRKDMWSLGFVTGDGMMAVKSAAGEPVVTVLVPTSPMPATGFTITVRKSETIELDITVDQAFQFIVSCGVVVPPPQQQHQIRETINAAIGKHLAGDTLGGATMNEPS
jgi:uncharacterized membrane protein